MSKAQPLLGTHYVPHLVHVNSYNPCNSVKSILWGSYPLLQISTESLWGPTAHEGSQALAQVCLTQNLGSAAWGCTFPLSCSGCGGRSKLMDFSEILLHFPLHWTDWLYCYGHIVSYGCCPVCRSGVSLNFLIYTTEIIAEPILRIVGRNEWVPAGTGNMVHTLYVLSLHGYHHLYQSCTLTHLWGWHLCLSKHAIC